MKKAFIALIYNGVRAAPLWDSVQQNYVGEFSTFIFSSLLVLLLTGFKVESSCLSLENEQSYLLFPQLLTGSFLYWYICVFCGMLNAGMLTITDFIKILQKYYKHRGVSSHILTYVCTHAILIVIFWWILFVPNPCIHFGLTKTVSYPGWHLFIYYHAKHAETNLTKSMHLHLVQV